MPYDPDEQEERAKKRIGQVLSGKWTLERMLGIGGMAAVYAGKHRNGAKAAVKVLHPELARHKEIRERFLREGYAANRVEHPGAVAVLDDDVVQGGPDDGAAYIVMELLEGEPLEARAARKPLDERELLMVADGILEVLEAAHPRGVVHRDLKPDNLFLLKTDDDSIKVKVLDFGLARMVLPQGEEPEGESRVATRAGVTIGTPAYMSPEQAAGRADEIDGRADIFSVGAVLFRLRTNKRIHEAGHPIELVGKMAKLPAPKIRDVDASVSPPFAAIVDRALAFRREDRYPDAAAMRADVLAALGPKVDPHGPKTERSPEVQEAFGSEPTEVATRFEPRYSPPSGASHGSLPPERSIVARSFPIFGLLFLGLLAAGAWIVFRDGIDGFAKSALPQASVSTTEADTGSPDTAAADTSTSEDTAALAVPAEAQDADTDAEEEEEEDEDAGPDASVEDAGPDDASIEDAAPEAATVDASLFQALKPTQPKPKKKPAPAPTAPKPPTKKKKKKKK